MAGITVKERHTREAMRLEIAQMKLEDARINQTIKMLETLPTFAQDEDERDWVVSSGNTANVYTEQELDNQRAQARVHARQPAGRNILQTMQDFIIGKSAAIGPEPENEEVQDYWSDWVDRNGFDLKAKEIVKRTIRDGESFLRWFPPATQDGDLQFRFTRPGEIKPSTSAGPTYGIKVNPDDYEDVIEYHRQYTTPLPGNLLQTEIIPAEEMDHVKIMVDSDVKRGVSFFIGIGKYMTEYNKWLDDRIKLNRLRAFFNVIGKVTSGSQPVSDVKSTLPDVTNSPPTGKDTKKKAVRSGSVLLTKGVEWDLKPLNIHANDTKEDGRSIQLMIALGTNFPEYITRGDASNANYASSMVSESPFVRAMESWQDFFEKVFKRIYSRVIGDAIARGLIPAKSKQKIFTFDHDKREDIETEEEVETSTDCTVNFATLIHRDIEKETKAVAIHMEAGLVSKKTASATFGYNWQEEQEQIARETAEEEAETLRRQELFGVPDNDGFPGANDANDDDEGNEDE